MQKLATAPTSSHRVLTVLTAVSLFIGLRGIWSTAIATHLTVGMVLNGVYALIMISAVCAFIARTKMQILIVDALILLTALASLYSGWILFHAGSDESSFIVHGVDLFLHGKPIYGTDYTTYLIQHNVYLTKTMDGHFDSQLAYPPLMVLLSAPVYLLHHSIAAVTFIGVTSVAAVAILMWVILPVKWKPVAVLSTIGFGFITGAARGGYPAMLALLFMVPVIAYWSRVGRDGKISKVHVGQAICLGLACTAQQLPWFMLPFLLIGLFTLRLPEVGLKRTLGVLGIYFGTAAATFLLVNLYFIIQNPKTWLSGILLPLTQNGIIHGQGIIGVIYYYTLGSAHLNYFSYATILLLAALCAISLLFMRKMGPTLFVLPWLPFFFSIRSQDNYFIFMIPLWFLGYITTQHAFTLAWQPRWLTTRRLPLRAGLVTLVLLPAFAFILAAVFSPAPLTLTFKHADLTSNHKAITGLTFTAQNTSYSPITPHFAYRDGHGESQYYTVLAGPKTLAPQQSATYVVRPPGNKNPHQGIDRQPGVRYYLIAVSDHPLTLSTLHIPKGALH